MKKKTLVSISLILLFAGIINYSFSRHSSNITDLLTQNVEALASSESTDRVKYYESGIEGKIDDEGNFYSSPYCKCFGEGYMDCPW